MESADLRRDPAQTVPRPTKASQTPSDLTALGCSLCDGEDLSDRRERSASEPPPAGTLMATTCGHLDSVRVTELPEAVEGCEDCLKTGDPWLHLRICLECGHVGCCDSSPNRHASAHARQADHPLIRSLEPGEEWAFCFVDEVGMVIPEIRGQTRIPPSPLGG